jgi:hypothetical protein
VNQSFPIYPKEPANRFTLPHDACNA